MNHKGRVLLSLGLLGIMFSACSREVTLKSPPISDESVPIKALTFTDNKRWQPVPGLDWQVQFTAPLEIIPGIEVYDLDLFETSVEDVATLHAQGARVVCYINMGAWEDWRPDADSFPDEVTGRIYAGWPGERWLDIRQIDLLAPILSARLDLCLQKGFDGVEPDNLDGYTNQTGFPLTYTDQLTFNRWVADAAHTRRLAVDLKNDPDQVIDLIDWFDWALLENCLVEGWCEQFTPFVNEGKPVVMIEYSYRKASLAEMCPSADAFGFDAMIKDRTLDAWREGCP